MNKKYSFQLRFIKKMFDNSYYPATYNIKKNCIEYPNDQNKSNDFILT